MSKTLRLLCLTVVVVAVGVSAQASHQWGNYHWSRSSNPFTIQLGDNVDSKWQTYLVGASADWTSSSVLNTTVVAGGTTGRKCRPTSGRVEVCNARYGNNGWLGIAQIWASGNHITQGVVKLNDSYFDTSTYNTPAWRRMVTCQEIGHTFGLDHQDENFSNPNLGTCMDYTNNPSGPPSNEHPNSHDYSMLVSIYSHTDLVDGGLTGPPPPAMNDLDLAGPGQWGRVVERSPQGLPLVYVADFGNGHRVYTFVTWVPGSRVGSR